MKRMFVPAFVLLFSMQALAQDVLTMRSGAEYEVKLLEITDHELRFKMYNNPEGPLYTISRSSFASVRYQNGMVEEFALKGVGDQQTISVNGYNVSATNELSGQSLASEEDQPGTGQVTIRERRSSIGQVVGALFNTGLLVLDIAAEFKEARKCAQQQGHSHSHARCTSN